MIFGALVTVSLRAVATAVASARNIVVTTTALDTVDPEEPVTILAPVVAVLGAVGAVFKPGEELVDSYCFRWVRSLLPHAEGVANDRGFYTTYTIRPEAEAVGVWHGSLDELEATLREEGYHFGLLASHKQLPDGRREVSSWVDVGGPICSGLLGVLELQLRTWQTHVTVFERDDGDGYLVTAHHERAAYSALTAYWHLRGRDLNVEKGRRIVGEQLAAEARFEPVD
ncbi:hypothetical protein HKK80_01860 [Halonotius sp. F2-221B]|uniref:hypothetical protein n=1 Tax=Halonotius sp. F2-221B TaxID=2731620 RepID=UPI00398A8E19